MLSKLAVRRLTKLADYMDSLPPAASKHFRMLHWFKHRGEHEHPYTGIKTPKEWVARCRKFLRENA